jgi:hypothetical protein
MAKVSGRHAVGIHLASPNQISAAAADPQVPGPGFIFPAPKKVATNVAHSGAGATACPSAIPAISFLVVIIFTGVAKVLHFSVVGILHGRRDDVLSASPFAEINQPATFAAEREVFGSLRNRFLADRTFQLDLGLTRHDSIVDGNQRGRRIQLILTKRERKLKEKGSSTRRNQLRSMGLDLCKSWPNSYALVVLVRPDVEQRRLFFGVAAHFIHLVHGDFAAFGFFLAALGAALDFLALFLLARLFLLALVEC